MRKLTLLTISGLFFVSGARADVKVEKVEYKRMAQLLPDQ